MTWGNETMLKAEFQHSAWALFINSSHVLNPLGPFLY